MKKKYAIISNIILVVLELIGLILTITKNKTFMIQYYTQDSNLFALIVSSIYLYYLVEKEKVPKIIDLLKYTSVLCLTITFLVVILVLAPMFNFNYKWFLFDGDFIFYHFLCPIISLVSFILFESNELKGIKDVIRSMSPTLIYSIILIMLNILNIVTGPYPFLEVRKNGIFISIIWSIVLLGSMFGLSFLLLLLKNKLNRKMSF